MPKGRSPVVLTFDDATNNQIAFGAEGETRPGLGGRDPARTSRRRHSDFPATGTFYVPRNAFEGNGATAAPDVPVAARARLRARQPHEGSHRRSNTLGATGVQRQLVLGQPLLSDRLPGYRPTTMALPLGALPHPASLAIERPLGRRVVPLRGVFLSARSRPVAVFDEVGPGRDPAHPHEPALARRTDFTAGMWLDLLERNPGLRYVSDGNPATISFPRGSETELATRYREPRRVPTRRQTRAISTEGEESNGEGWHMCDLAGVVERQHGRRGGRRTMTSRTRALQRDRSTNDRRAIAYCAERAGVRLRDRSYAQREGLRYRIRGRWPQTAAGWAASTTGS